MNAANGAYSGWIQLCPPAQLYAIVMTAFVLFQLYRGTYRYAIRHAIFAILGTAFLWVLCAAKMEFAAYGLLVLPVLFFVFLLAIILYDQSLFEIQREYKGEEDCGCCAEETAAFCDCCN
jgi:FlaA1/EpsC-like NDP-sugar epimerase